MVRVEVIDKFSALITAAFGLVAAIAWNDAIQRIFKQFFGEHGSLVAAIWYAIIVTVVAVVATLWIGRVAEKAKSVQPRIPFVRKKEKQTM